MKTPTMPSLSTLKKGSLILAISASSYITANADVTVISDDFDTFSTDTWSSKAVSDNGSFTANSSIMSIDAGPSGGTPRGTIVSNSYDINPFTYGHLSVTLDSWDVTAASGSPYAFALVGKYSSDSTLGAIGDGSTAIYNYFPGASGLNALTLSLYYSTVADLYYLQFKDLGGGSATTSASFQLDAKPTSITWDIYDDGNYTVSLSDSTFTSGGSSTYNGSYTNFSEAGLSDGNGNYISRLAIGAVSANAVTTLDSVNAVLVPEPTTAALLIGLCSLSLTIARRRKR